MLLQKRENLSLNPPCPPFKGGRDASTSQTKTNQNCDMPIRKGERVRPTATISRPKR